MFSGFQIEWVLVELLDAFLGEDLGAFFIGLESDWFLSETQPAIRCFDRNSAGFGPGLQEVVAGEVGKALGSDHFLLGAQAKPLATLETALGILPVMRLGEVKFCQVGQC